MTVTSTSIVQPRLKATAHQWEHMMGLKSNRRSENRSNPIRCPGSGARGACPGAGAAWAHEGATGLVIRGTAWCARCAGAQAAW